MPSYKTERATQIVIGKYTDWIKRFDVGEYVQNPPLIEKLYEEKQLALVRVTDLESQVKELEIKLHALEMENQATGIQLSEANRKASFSFTLSLLATVLVGIGVNVATSTPNGWTGWVMVVVACVIEITSFLIKPKNKKN